jgi:hypothetical protein
MNYISFYNLIRCLVVINMMIFFIGMKNISFWYYKIIFSVLALMSLAVAAKSQNLALMSQAQRDAILISKAKAVILRYGPDYYREYKPPVITRHIVPNDILITGIDKKHAGRAYYTIIYLYDKTKEILDSDYAANVVIWEDTGKPFEILFGSHFFISIPNEDFENDNVTIQVPYKQKTIHPIYEPKHTVINLPPDADSVTIATIMREAEEKNRADRLNKKNRGVPLNIDELRKYGYEEDRDGNWVKTRPDIPPK